MRKKKVGVIVQARMGSTRLPGKILTYLDKNERVLDLLIKRLKLSQNLDQIIIATTQNNKDLQIIETAKSHDVLYFVGSENNVLKRFYEAAKYFELDIVVRVTSDCPFVDPYIMDDMIDFYMKKGYDYIRNIEESTNFPRGFDIEIFSFKTLQKVFSLASSKPEMEHVTYFIYTHPSIFKIKAFNYPNLKKIDDLRLTIDEEDDLNMCREVYKRIKKKKGKTIDFTLNDIIDIIEKEPELIEINKKVQHKKM